MEKHIYIAGFECFLENGMEISKKSVDLCKKEGFVGISPMIGLEGVGEELDFKKDKKEVAKTIFQNNLKYIEKSDIIIANLNNFRGWELDAGVCFEIGYAYTKNKKIYGFMSDTRPCYEKYIGNVHKDGVFWRDDNGAFFEGGVCNLMISGHATIVEGDFEAALLRVKNDLLNEKV